MWVGKDERHPNTPEHHIVWIEVFFIPSGSETPIPLGKAYFLGHGDVSTEPRAVFYAKIGKGKVVAVALCNIHGLWVNEKEVV